MSPSKVCKNGRPHFGNPMIPVVFERKCFNWDTSTTKIFFRNDAAQNKDEIKVFTQFQCLMGHPVL